MSQALLVGALIGAVSIPFAVGMFPVLLGFAIGGIVGGSPASMMMAYHDGYVPVDGFVARMQARGEMGFLGGYNKYTIALGALVGMVFNAYVAIHRDHFCSGDGPH